MATGHGNQASLSGGCGPDCTGASLSRVWILWPQDGAAEGSPGCQRSTTRSGPALQTRRGESAGDGLWWWWCRKAEGPHRASRGEPQLQA